MENFFVLVAWLGEQRERFRSTFDRKWFSPAGALGHQIVGQDSQEFLLQSETLFLVAGLGPGNAELTHRVDWKRVSS